MKDEIMDPIEAEVDAIRQKIWNRIKGMSSDEKRAYYRAKAEALRKEFNITVSNLKPVPPIRKEDRRARPMMVGTEIGLKTEPVL